MSIAPRDRFIASGQEAREPAQFNEEVSRQMERQSKLRNDSDADNGLRVKKRPVQRTEEPPYDPSNPWHK